MFKTLTKTLVILLLPCLLQAADVDSLKLALENKTNSTETTFQLYFELGKSAYEIYDYATAKDYIKKGLDLATSIGNPQQEFRFLNELGYIYFWMDEYTAALEWSLKAKELRHVAPKKEMAYNLSRISEIYVATGSYTEALEHQLQALEIFEITQDSLGIGNSMRLMGTISWYKKELDQSLQYTHQALSIFERTQDKKSTFTCLAAISSVLTEKGELESALDYAQRSLTLATEIEYAYGVGFSQGMVGSIQKEMGRYELAFVNIQQALDMFDKLNVKYEKIEFSIMLADLYDQRGEPNQAIPLYLQNLELARNINSLALLRDINESLSDTYESIGDSARALTYFKQYTFFKDSLMNEEILGKMNELEQGYSTQKKEKEILHLQQQSQKFYIYAATIGIGFLLLTVWLFYLRFKTQDRINELLSVKNQEIAERNDRLANSNAELRQFADIISKDLKEPLRMIGSTANTLEKEAIYAESSGISSLASNILQGVNRMDSLLADLSAYSVEGFDEEPYETFDIREVVYQIISDLPPELHAQGVKIHVKNLPTVNANRRQITLIFRNLIENALKFRREQDPEVIIDSEKKRRYYRFSIGDNGIGIPVKEQKAIFSAFKRLEKGISLLQGTGMGLAVCKKIVQLHNGKIWVHSQPNEGSTFYFTLPR